MGQNLQDHLDFTLAYKSKDRDNFGISLPGSLSLLKHIANWRSSGRGMQKTPRTKRYGGLDHFCGSALKDAVCILF